jgi:hypothetical protein
MSYWECTSGTFLYKSCHASLRDGTSLPTVALNVQSKFRRQLPKILSQELRDMELRQWHTIKAAPLLTVTARATAVGTQVKSFVSWNNCLQIGTRSSSRNVSFLITLNNLLVNECREATRTAEWLQSVPLAMYTDCVRNVLNIKFTLLQNMNNAMTVSLRMQKQVKPKTRHWNRKTTKHFTSQYTLHASQWHTTQLSSQLFCWVNLANYMMNSFDLSFLPWCREGSR